MSEKHATKSLKLTIAIFTGLVLGILMGFLMPGRMEWAVPVLDLVSGIYMNALRMMIYPLVFCSLIVYTLLCLYHFACQSVRPFSA